MSDHEASVPRPRVPFNIWNVPTRGMRYNRGLKGALIDPQIGADNFDLHLNTVRAGDPGGPYHLHTSAENAYVILGGTALVKIDGQSHEVSSGSAVFIPPGVPHSLTNIGDDDLRVLEIYAPPNPDFVEVSDPD